MFYLTQFFKALKMAPVRGFLFITMTISLLVAWGQIDTVEKKLFNKLSSKTSGTYFHALISSKENVKSIARKLRQLPGVHTAKTLSESKIKAEVERLLGSFKEDLQEELVNLEFSGIKILFDEEIKVRSQQLIRDYLLRLVGPEKVTLGPIKKPDSESVKNTMITKYLKTWGASGIIAILFVLWAFCFQLFSSVVASQSYLVEQFQRKSYVRVKTLLSGMAGLFVLATIAMTVFGQPQYINLIFFVGVAFIALLTQVRKSKWNH